MAKGAGEKLQNKMAERAENTGWGVGGLGGLWRDVRRGEVQ